MTDWENNNIYFLHEGMGNVWFRKHTMPRGKEENKNIKQHNVKCDQCVLSW